MTRTEVGLDNTSSVVGDRLAISVVDAIRAVMGPRSVPLHEPLFIGNEWQYLKECLDSTFVSSVGGFVDRFESELAAYTKSKYAVAFVTGTAALHIALKLAGVATDDEVLVPAITFVATANAVTYCGAVPHFVATEGESFGIDATVLREYLKENTERRNNSCVNRNTGRRIKVLLPMHTFGHPSDIDSLLAVAHDFNLALIEDAAESIGSTYRGQHTGTFGLMGILSFNGNKTISTGGGGALLTDNKDIATKARHLGSTAKIPHAWEYKHDDIGYNYRMPGLNAALGCAQLEQLPGILDAKRQLFDRYDKAFSSVSGVRLIREPKNCCSNYWLQTLEILTDSLEERDQILQTTNDVGYMTRPVWIPLHQLGQFVNSPKMDLAYTEQLAQRLVNIPSSVYV